MGLFSRKKKEEKKVTAPVAQDVQLYTEAEALYAQKEYEKSLPLFEKAAELGNQNAQYRCGFQYYFGEGTEQNFEKALFRLEKIAPLAPNAQYACGIIYKNGLGTAVNDEKAIYWLKKAAEAGGDAANHLEEIQNRIAMFQKAVQYARQGDMIHSFEYMKKAADLGHVQAMCMVGKCIAVARV